MRLSVLVFAAILGPSVAEAQPAAPGQDEHFNLPVSVERIRAALERPTLLSLRALDERPTFRVQILEKQRIDELLATLNFKTTRASAGGLYWDDIQRVTWPAVDNPMLQPYGAFSAGQIVTLAVEDAIGKLGAGKLVNAIGGAAKNRAQTAAREEVLQAIQEYCTAQPNAGAGIQICSTSSAVR